jgi:malonate transporter
MRAVVTGFVMIWSVTAVGYLIARVGLLGPEGGSVLNRLVFLVANPALLAGTLATTRPGAIFTPALAAFVLSAVGVAGLYLVLAGRIWRRRTGEMVIGALAASYVNAANLGLPIAAYVLGDVSLIAPILLFQVLVAAPVALAILDIAAAGRRPSPRRLLLLPIRNPLLLGCVAGLSVAVTGWQPPPEVLRPVELLGSAAVPLALLTLGMSLHGSRPLTVGAEARQRYTAVALKVLAQPLLAYLLARGVLGLTGPTLLAAVVTAGLPTAQNVFVFATHHRQGQALARDAVMLSTAAAALPLAVAATALG